MTINTIHDSQHQIEIVDYAVGATTLDLLIRSDREFTPYLRRARGLRRRLGFVELPSSNSGRHFQADLREIQSDYDLRILGDDRRQIPVIVLERLTERPMRTRITSQKIAGSYRELVLNHNSIGIRGINGSAPSVSKIMVYTSTIDVTLCKEMPGEIEFRPRSQAFLPRTLVCSSRGVLTIHKEWLREFQSVNGSLLINLVDSNSGQRLSYENPEVGSPRELFAYSAMSLVAENYRVSARPYWTADGYLSLKIVTKRA